MLATKVACPHCQAVLKSAQALAADRALTCLRCGTVFTAGGAVLPPSAGAGRQPSLRVTTAPVAAPFSPPPLRGTSRKALLTAIVGGLLLFIGGGVVLAIYCFSGGQRTDAAGAGATEDGGPEPVVVSVSPVDKTALPPPPGGGEPASVVELPPAGAKPPPIKPDAPAPEPVPPRPAAGAPPAQAGLTARQKQINEAIDRGAKFLKTSQFNSGRWDMGNDGVGYAALPGLTLLECGVPANDPAVQRAAKYVRQHARALDSVHTTYELSLAILFLDRLGENGDRELIQTMALRLIAGQNTTGGWTYRVPHLSAADHKHLLAFLRRHQKESLMDPLGTASASGSNPLGSTGGTLQDPLQGSTSGQLPSPLQKPGGSQVADPLYKPAPEAKPGLLQPIDLGGSAAVQTDKEKAAPGQAKLVDIPKKTVKNTPGKPAKTDPLPEHLKNLTVVHMNDGSVKPRILAPKARAKAKAKANPKQLLRGISGDNSNTQFAILALWVARRHGVPMERTLALIDHRFQSSQNADGGWGYHYQGEKAVTKNTMTCVGLLGLAVGHGFAQETAAALKDGKGAAPPKEKAQDLAIQRGLKKLGQYLANPMRNGDMGGPINLYYLWSVERVGVLYNLKTIGNKDWYGWATDLLLPTQNANGSWWTRGFHGHSTTVDTCLALLILRRTNLVQDLTDNLRMLAITDPDARRASGR